VPALLQSGRPGQNEINAGLAAAERRALEIRLAELTARAALPGSPLACLDALAGEVVESACEQNVFASPSATAAAVSYAAARLRLLADGVAFARRYDPSYEASLADLRMAAETDAYGIYAHVLATRDGCTPEQCAAFAFLRDPSMLKVHLRQRLYATYVAEHRDRWGAPIRSTAATPVSAIAAAAQFPPLGPPAAVADPAEVPPPLPKARPTTVAEVPVTASVAPDEPPPATEARSARRGIVPPAASAVPNIDFPSSSSIPAISILAAEPKLPAEAAAAAPSTAPRRPASPQ